MLKSIGDFFGYGCLHCGRIVPDVHDILCTSCKKQITDRRTNDSDVIISAINYRTEPAKTLITSMKSEYDPYIFDYAASLIEDKLRDIRLIHSLSDFYISYAPRDPKSHLKKRFDQSKEIADFLAMRLFGDHKSRVLSMFSRSPFAKEQKKLGASERAGNVKKLFKVKRRVDIPEKLIIIDDVTTTGSTLLMLRELAFKAGVRECVLCTVAVNDVGAHYNTGIKT